MPAAQLSAIMASKKVILEETGCSSVEVTPNLHLLFTGNDVQTGRAASLLKRIAFHVQWGTSVLKVQRLIKPPPFTGCLVKLSSMSAIVPASEHRLGNLKESFRIGTDKSKCDVVIDDPVLSRKHCAIVFDSQKGACFVIDQSTNGTYLNRKRLPKPKGKTGPVRVLLSHADELLLKAPEADLGEFGYVVNLAYT